MEELHQNGEDHDNHAEQPNLEQIATVPTNEASEIVQEEQAAEDSHQPNLDTPTLSDQIEESQPPIPKPHESPKSPPSPAHPQMLESPPSPLQLATSGSPGPQPPSHRPSPAKERKINA